MVKMIIVAGIVAVLAGAGVILWLGQGGETSMDEVMEFSVYFITPQTGTVAPDYDCGAVEPVRRLAGVSPDVARTAILALIAGPTADEAARGYRSGIDHDTKINRLVISPAGVAEIDFSSELERGSGGSCNVLSIQAQIEKTLLQFPSIKRVDLTIDGRREVLQP